MRLAARAMLLAAAALAAGGCSGSPAAPDGGVEPPAAPGPNLLYNGGFEEWEGDRPKGWAAAEGAGDTWTPLRPGRVKGLGRGSVAVELPAPAPGATAILAQNLSARWIAPGRPLRFGAMARADAPEQAQVVLQFRAGGELRKVRVVHPGNGAWEALEETVAIPADADPASFRIELFRQPGDGRVIYDLAGVAYADGAPPPAHDPGA